MDDAPDTIRDLENLEEELTSVQETLNEVAFLLDRGPVPHAGTGR